MAWLLLFGVVIAAADGVGVERASAQIPPPPDQQDTNAAPPADPLGNLAFPVPDPDAGANPAKPNSNPDTNPDLAPPENVGPLAPLQRGPVHEAFAGPVLYDPRPGPTAPRAPPEPIEELPPDIKPDGKQVEWIPGYWAWDEDAAKFIWISGIWRDIPPGREWVPGYWTAEGDHFRWVAGYWAKADDQPIEYLPEPPESLEHGPNTPEPDENHFWAPGEWQWMGDRYVWRPGVWVKNQPDWVWNPGAYYPTPSGYIHNDGFWDYPLADRGVLYAPAEPVVDVIPAHFVYTPDVVVPAAGLVDHLFCSTAVGGYHFGDFYDPVYFNRGFIPWSFFPSYNVGFCPIYNHCAFNGFALGAISPFRRVGFVAGNFGLSAGFGLGFGLTSIGVGFGINSLGFGCGFDPFLPNFGFVGFNRFTPFFRDVYCDHFLFRRGHPFARPGRFFRGDVATNGGIINNGGIVNVNNNFAINQGDNSALALGFNGGNASALVDQSINGNVAHLTNDGVGLGRGPILATRARNLDRFNRRGEVMPAAQRQALRERAAQLREFATQRERIETVAGGFGRNPLADLNLNNEGVSVRGNQETSPLRGAALRGLAPRRVERPASPISARTRPQLPLNTTTPRLSSVDPNSPTAVDQVGNRSSNNDALPATNQLGRRTVGAIADSDRRGPRSWRELASNRAVATERSSPATPTNRPTAANSNTNTNTNANANRPNTPLTNRRPVVPGPAPSLGNRPRVPVGDRLPALTNRTNPNPPRSATSTAADSPPSNPNRANPPTASTPPARRVVRGQSPISTPPPLNRPNNAATTQPAVANPRPTVIESRPLTTPRLDNRPRVPSQSPSSGLGPRPTPPNRPTIVDGPSGGSRASQPNLAPSENRPAPPLNRPTPAITQPRPPRVNALAGEANRQANQVPPSRPTPLPPAPNRPNPTNSGRTTIITGPNVGGASAPPNRPTPLPPALNRPNPTNSGRTTIIQGGGSPSGLSGRPSAMIPNRPASPATANRPVFTPPALNRPNAAASPRPAPIMRPTGPPVGVNRPATGANFRPPAAGGGVIRPRSMDGARPGVGAGLGAPGNRSVIGNSRGAAANLRGGRG